MTDLEIVYRNPAELKGYGRNSRKHSDEQVRLIRRSIDEFGFANPILIKDDGKTIGAGHARQAAALLDPPLERVPTVVLHGLSDLQWRAYVVADNRLAEAGSSWDLGNLKLELDDLELGGFDLSIAGIETTDFSKLFAAPMETEDKARAWGGMPAFDQEDKRAFKSVVMHFPDQAAVDAFAKLIKQKITPATRFAWYPAIVIDRYADKQYEDGK